MATSTLRPTQPAARTAVLASADLSFRQRVRDALTGLRWQVREASGGAEALSHLDSAPAETVILDSWLPDLEIQEFITEFEKLHPSVDLVTVDDAGTRSSTVRSPRRNEVLYALRAGQDADGVASDSAPEIERRLVHAPVMPLALTEDERALNKANSHLTGGTRAFPASAAYLLSTSCRLPEFIGEHQIQTEDNGIEITTSNGALLVSGQQSFSLSTAPVSGSLHVFDSEGNDITSSLSSGGGQIGGLLTVRDQDIPQMQSALDTLAYDFGTAVNTQNEAGSDANGNPGVAIFTLPASATGAAAGISVAVTDPSQIAAAATGAGSSDDTNLLAMASLQNQAIIGGATPSNYYSDFVTTIGSLVSGVSTQNAAQQASVSQLQNQVNSLSSVNLNEEASSLETFEQSYQSASKIFTILDEVMTAALNLGVETTYTS